MKKSLLTLVLLASLLLAGCSTMIRFGIETQKTLEEAFTGKNPDEQQAAQ